MTRTWRGLAVLLGAAVVAFVALAAEEEGKKPDKQAAYEAKAQRLVDNLTADLTLTAEQQAKIKPILVEYFRARDELDAKMRKDVAALLTEEQQQRYKELAQQRRQQEKPTTGEAAK